jgi:hypothetical protein
MAKWSMYDEEEVEVKKDADIGFSQVVMDKLMGLGSLQDCVDTLVAAIIALEVYGVASYDQNLIVAEAQKLAVRVASCDWNLDNEGDEE